MRNLLKRELARVLRAVAAKLEKGQEVSPEPEHLEDSARMSPVPPTFIPVPYPCPYPAPPLDVRPWPGYPQPYIGDPWPPPYVGITWTSDSLILPTAPNGEAFPLMFSNN